MMDSGAAAAEVTKKRRIICKSTADSFVVTRSAASVIGRITGQSTAGEIFSERVCAEVQEYLSQVHEATAKGSSSIAAARWRCHLCPFKSFTEIRFLRSHVQKQHEGGMKHPILNYVASSRNLFDTCTTKPAPWDLLKPGGASGVSLSKDWGWKALVRGCPLAETAGIVRTWNIGVNRPEAFKRGCYRSDFRSLITEKRRATFASESP